MMKRQNAPAWIGLVALVALAHQTKADNALSPSSAFPNPSSSSSSSLSDRRSEEAAETFFALWRKDTRQAMDMLPPKWDAAGQKPHPQNVFAANELRTQAFVDKKAAWRSQALCTWNPETCHDDGKRAAIAGNDLPENLIDKGTKMIRNLAEMDRVGLRRIALSIPPWSDTYWPTYKGIIAARYADPYFPNAEDWRRNRDYVRQRPSTSIVATGQQAAIDNLSPAEKLDLLYGNTMMTQRMWGEGEKLFRSDGRVEKWMGICHGWAVASYMMSRPKLPVVLTAADAKTKITFFPADIKAYASLLWANGKYDAAVIGGRCEVRRPRTDAVGRTLLQNCFDTNPGTWHLAAVNQLGIARRSLIFDATYDYEVWNQPLYSYTYRYFNPMTMQQTDSLAYAVANLPMRGDRFRAYRSPRARQIVGIIMDATYIVEVDPIHTVKDNVPGSMSRTVQYIYDVELDAKGNIIGGEWYVNRHPDFLWTPIKGTRVATTGNTMATEGWNPASPLPPSWQAAGLFDAQTSLPLPKLVERLFALSQRGYGVSLSTPKPASSETPAPTRPTTPPTRPLPPSPAAIARTCARLPDGTYVPKAANGALILDPALVQWYYQSLRYQSWYWGTSSEMCQYFLRTQKKGRICSIGAPYALYQAANGQRLTGPLASAQVCANTAAQ